LHLAALFVIKNIMTPNGRHTPEKEILRIVRQMPGIYFYTKTALTILAAWRLSRKGLYTKFQLISSSLGILKTLEVIGVDVGIENLAAYKTLRVPCVFVGNHMSVLETFLFPCLILPYRRFTFVLKKSLLQYPIISHIIQTLNPIVVNRTNPREDLRKVMAEGLACLKQNISVIIFPQTTRSLQFNPNHFNSLGVKLARRAEVPVIPVAVKTDAWGIGSVMKDLGKIDPSKPVRISFGDPLTISGNGKQEQRIITDFISAKLTGWGTI
jgi:1-acyl-sn-glycerol-3-phosphate acyltransferase